MPKCGENHNQVMRLYPTFCKNTILWTGEFFSGVLLENIFLINEVNKYTFFRMDVSVKLILGHP